MKRYAVKIRNCAGTTLYVIPGKYTGQLSAFTAAKGEFKWFARDPDITKIVEAKNNC